MVLYLIGIGLCDEKDITLRGLETVRKCDTIFLETYTSKLRCSIKAMESLYGKTVIAADRDLVEKDAERIIEAARTRDAAFLVIGDVFSATTHTDLLLRAKEVGIKTEVIHNASVLTAIGSTGLELYKFGKTTSVPYAEKNWIPKTPYQVLANNLALGYHTLLLLDIKAEQERFMTAKEAIQFLLDVEKEEQKGIFTPLTRCVACARLGCPDQKIAWGTAQELLAIDLGDPLHCLIVPGKMHFIEEDALTRHGLR